MGKGNHLSSKEWNDVADLFNECASMCETFYEEHDPRARTYAAHRLFRLAIWAQGKQISATKIEERRREANG